MKNKKLFLSFIAIFVLLLLNNHNVPFWDQDEPAYAGFAFNMLEQNQWVIPDFPFSDVHRKPPLHFWLIAFFNFIFGYNEFTVRFSSS
jgi:4-amino-4-deoxy-L-arabinose transferase-like glycosyltransferase